MKEVAILLCVFLFGCSEINKELNLPDDNLFEEAIEVVIYQQTNIDVDLTPSTPEVNKW